MAILNLHKVKEVILKPSKLESGKWTLDITIGDMTIFLFADESVKGSIPLKFLESD